MPPEDIIEDPNASEPAAAEPVDVGAALLGGEVPPADGEGGDAPAAPDWMKGVTQDPDLIKFVDGQDQEAVIRRAMGLHRDRREKGILPPKDGDDVDLERYLNELGRPTEADNYSIELPEGIPQNDDVMAIYRGLAHKAGLTQAQAQDMYAGLAKGLAEIPEDNAAKLEAEQEGRNQFSAGLRTAWGEKSQVNGQLLNGALKAVFKGDEDRMKKFQNGVFNIGANEATRGEAMAMIDAMVTLGRKTQEGGAVIVPGMQGAVGGGLPSTVKETEGAIDAVSAKINDPSTKSHEKPALQKEQHRLAQHIISLENNRG